MKLKSDLFPYPVLNHELDDYNHNDSFSCNFSFNTISQNIIEIEAKFELNNNGLKNLIQTGKATYLLHIEGCASYYRKSISSVEDIIKHKDNKSYLPKRFEINAMVIAKEDIPEYRNSDFNSLYYDSEYKVRNIKKGDILAFVNTIEYQLEIENIDDISEKSMILVKPIEGDLMKIELCDEQIIVKLPKEIYRLYSLSGSDKESKRNLFNMAFIIPGLVAALEALKKQEIDNTLKWVIALDKLLKENNYNLNNMDTIEVAQKLLDLPLRGIIIGTVEDNIDED